MSEHDDREAALRPRLTDEFFATLVEAADLGSGDYIEIDAFVREVFQMAGKQPPEKETTQAIAGGE